MGSVYNIQGHYGYTIEVTADDSGEITLSDRQKEEFFFATVVNVRQGDTVTGFYLYNDNPSARNFIGFNFSDKGLLRIQFQKDTGIIIRSDQPLA